MTRSRATWESISRGETRPRHPRGAVDHFSSTSLSPNSNFPHPLYQHRYQQARHLLPHHGECARTSRPASTSPTPTVALSLLPACLPPLYALTSTSPTLPLLPPASLSNPSSSTPALPAPPHSPPVLASGKTTTLKTPVRPIVRIRVLPRSTLARMMSLILKLSSVGNGVDRIPSTRPRRRRGDGGGRGRGQSR